MKILLIRFLAIGDVVLTSSLCSSLRKSFPDAQIDYLMHAVSGPLFEHHPDIDNVITLSQQERKNPLKYIAKAWSVARNKYDIIIDATSTEKSQFISLFSPSCKYRIGRTKGKKGIAFTHKIPRHEFVGNKIEQRMRLLKPLQQAGFDIQTVPQISLFYSNEEKQILKQRMVEQGISFDRPIFAFSVSAKEAHKKWPIEYMTEVVAHCLEKHAAQILIFGGMPHERPDQIAIFNRLERNADIFIDVASPSLRELGALLCHCDMFIGNEGGPRHMAHAVGVPTATVFSPASRVAEWLPDRGPRHQAIEWQDVCPPEQHETDFSKGDDTYMKLYQSIKPAHFIAIIDAVVDSSEALTSDR